MVLVESLFLPAVLLNSHLILQIYGVVGNYMSEKGVQREWKGIDTWRAFKEMNSFRIW